MSRKFNPFRRHARAKRGKTRPVTIRAAWIGGICGIAAAVIGVVLAYVLSSASTTSSATPATSVTATAGPDLKAEEVDCYEQPSFK